MQLIEKQCKKKNAVIEHTVTFEIVDEEELYISFIDFTNVNEQQWRLTIAGKPDVGKILLQHIHHM